MQVLFKGAQVCLPEGFRRLDVLAEDGRIADLGEKLSAPEALPVSCESYVLLPGFVDVHVHLREPGFSYKETITSGTRAAAHGGYTTVCTMPNLSPAPDTPEHLAQQLELIRQSACIHVRPYGCVTMGQKGKELAMMRELAPDVIGFSDDGVGVQDEDLMCRAMQQAAALGLPIADHCEEEALLCGGYIHKGAYAQAHGHAGICSESEWKQVLRDARLAQKTGCHVHFCHLSTAQSVQIVREYKAMGAPISAETAPHYLLLCEEDLQEDGRFKMNPPLRTAEDREALVRGLVDGTIDCIATDHAPHSAAEKGAGLKGSKMGVVGLESAFALLYTHLVLPGKLTLLELVKRMSTRPCGLFGLLGGRIERGAPADFSVWDLHAKDTVNPGAFLSMGKATPFEGWPVSGRCMLTMCDGRFAYRAEEGEENA